VQLFYDLLQTKDSTILLTSCVIDPYQTYYKLSVDATVNCFVNMYFDLCEIERRAFDAKCRKEALDQAHIEERYKEAQQNLDAVLTDFLTQVDRGQNRKAMLKWNAFITEQIGIDNVALFALYP
jgi:hypothetical protein